MILRPRQIKAVADLRAAYKAGKVAPILCAVTGFGKTAASTVMIRNALAKGLRVWFVAHLREILTATAGKLTDEKIPHGWIAAGIDGDRHQAVQLVMVQTLARRLDRYTPPDLIIVDEAHLAVAQTYQDVFQWAKAGPKHFVPGGARLLHLTATPRRLDGRGMGEIADTIIPTCSTAELVDEGLLAPVRYYAPPGPDLSAVHSTAGDFNIGELASAMDKPRITGCAIDHYRRVAHGRPAVAFCCSIEHAQHTAQAFVAAGYRAVAISGDSDQIERDAALAGLQSGLFDVVCNCALWVAGVDAPAVSCIIMLAPTQSLVKYLQSIGRGLRTHPGKPDCIVLDHAGNLDRHGSPLDARAWSLNGAGPKKSANRETPVKSCPSCFATVSALASHCICGHAFVVKPRTIAEVEGELAEIELQAARKVEDEALAEKARKNARVAQGRSSQLEDLINLARSRGYKRPELWARSVIRGRVERDQRKIA